MKRAGWALVVLVAAGLIPTTGWASHHPELLRGDARLGRVLLIGDSFVAQAFGRGLEQELSNAGFAVLRRGKHSSGLARPDFFDWWREASRLVARHDPTLIIVMMGGNDGQDLLESNGKGRVRWGGEEWEEQYAARIESFLNTLEAGPRAVLWLELPPMRGARFEKKVEYIRGIQRETLSGIPSTRYVPVGDLLRDSAGRLLQTLRLEGGATCTVHDSDGVHLTQKAGWALAEWVASRILPDMLQTDLSGDDGPGSEDSQEDDAPPVGMLSPFDLGLALPRVVSMARSRPEC
jgi:uncharacterized protein